MNVRGEPVRPIYTESVGIVSAEVYLDERIYYIFLVGDKVKGFIGSFRSLEDCKREINWLRQVSESELFKQAASAC